MAAALAEMRKEMAGVEFKLKDKEMATALICSSWENKYNALQV